MASISVLTPGSLPLPSVDLEEGSAKPCCGASTRERACVTLAYTWFAFCTGVVSQQFSDQDFSAVLTLSAGVQALGLLLLVYKVHTTKTVAGLSARSLEMYAAFFVFRLSSTLFKNGYIPVDRSGDWVYQSADILSLLMVMQLLFSINITHRSTYQHMLDTVEMWRAIPGCILLAIFVHGDLNAHPLFDTLWTVSLNLDAIALIPQLVMLYKTNGATEGLNAHYVFAIFCSRGLSFWFWFHGFSEVAPQKGGQNTAGWLIITVHSFILLTCADFVLQYIKAAVKAGQHALEVFEEK
jgi:hypothetical protein